MLHNMIGHNSPLDRLRQRLGRVVRATGRAAALSRRDEQLVHEILSSPVDYIDNPAYSDPDAEYNIYEDVSEVRRPDVAWYRPLMDKLTPETKHQSMRHTATLVLTMEEEGILFSQYNYARSRVTRLQREIGSGDPTDEQAQELLRWYRTAKKYREQIAETNLALVLAMAKRTRMSEVDFTDLVSEGNMALLRSIDKFDFARGFKFSTYACRAILKAFSRQGMKLSKYRQRFPTDFDPAMEKSNHLETVRRTHEQECAAEVKQIVMGSENEADLTDIERTVLHHRFCLDTPEGAASLTLEQVGQIIGVTKERVRQIQNKALVKIRETFELHAARKEEKSNDEIDADFAKLEEIVLRLSAN